MTVGPPIDAVKVDAGGRKLTFRFPNQGNLRDIVTSILAGHEYSLPPLPDYRATTIVDIGANVGAAAVFFHLAYPDGRLLCYEPSSDNLRFLRANLAEIPSAVVRPFGLLDGPGTAPLYRGNFQSAQHSLVRSIETGSESETVELRAAAADFEELGVSEISILKIDTEGAEVPILRNIQDWWARTDIIYVEYHSETDRLEIETMLVPEFMLFSAKSEMPHRGTNGYLARRMTARYPELDRARIVASGS